MEMIDISFVVPCLNEEKTLGLVLDSINSIRGQLDGKSEVIVSDNGSTDSSRSIALSKGARINSVATRGYGAALQSGINNANGKIVVFADADFTYDFTEAPKLIEHLKKNELDLVLGDRLNGDIRPGAMPLLHRYLGTPVLSFLISVMVGNRPGVIKDCNSGFRVFLKQAFVGWGTTSNGMEFASEMLIKALENKSKIGWVPITLRPDLRDRVPHLRTWRDGMRHLLQILVAAPDFISSTGIAFFFLGAAVAIPSSLDYTFKLGAFSLLGIHSLVFSFMVLFIGLQLHMLGLMINAAKKKMDSKLISMTEDRLFFFAAGAGLFSLVIWSWIFIQWSQANYMYLNFPKLSLVGTMLGLIAINFILGLVGVHILKRT